VAARLDPGAPRVDHHGLSQWDPGSAIAGLVQADDDTVRDVIHAFNRLGLGRWTLGGRAAVPPDQR
jgi:hypothetical protein